VSPVCDSPDSVYMCLTILWWHSSILFRWSVNFSHNISWCPLLLLKSYVFLPNPGPLFCLEQPVYTFGLRLFGDNPFMHVTVYRTPVNPYPANVENRVSS
jgi:hypothetical protein